MSEGTDVAPVESAEVEVDPFAGRTKKDLLGDYALMEGLAGVVTGRSQKLREELERRAQTELREEGTKPAWTVPGLARVAVRGGDEHKVGIVDRKALTSWLAENFPSEVTGTIELAAGDLPAALEALDAHSIRPLRSEAVPRESFVPTIVKKCELVAVPKTNADGAAIEDAQGKPVLEYVAIYTTTGAVVDGLGAVPGAPFGLTITVDKEAKARVAFQVEGAADDLAERLDAALARPALPAASPPPFDSARDVEHDEPEEAAAPHDPLCRCGAAESEHAGAKNRGGYRPNDCKRFREQPQDAAA